MGYSHTTVTRSNNINGQGGGGSEKEHYFCEGGSWLWKSDPFNCDKRLSTYSTWRVCKHYLITSKYSSNTYTISYIRTYRSYGIYNSGSLALL